MITQQDLVDEAYTWLGTPFHDAQRVKGVGVDCWGMIGEVFRKFGFDVPDKLGYQRNPRDKDLWNYADGLQKKGLVKRVYSPQPADVLFLTLKTRAHHMAMYTNKDTIIHAYQPSVKKDRQGNSRSMVMEHSYREPWPSRTLAIFRLSIFCNQLQTG